MLYRIAEQFKDPEGVGTDMLMRLRPAITSLKVSQKARLLTSRIIVAQQLAAILKIPQAAILWNRQCLATRQCALRMHNTSWAVQIIFKGTGCHTSCFHRQ